MQKSEQPVRIAFLLDNLSGGGAEKVILNLAAGFARLGHPVDLLVCKAEGVLQNYIPAGVNLIPLRPVSLARGTVAVLFADPAGYRAILGTVVRGKKLPKAFRYIPAISRHLKRSRASLLVSALPKSNINAVLAQRMSGTDTRVVLGAHIHLSAQDSEGASRGKVRIRALRPMMQRYYHQANAVVAVSKGVERDTRAYLDLPQDMVKTIYNPVAAREIKNLSEESPEHAWFESRDVPVVLGIGRFVAAEELPAISARFCRVA